MNKEKEMQDAGLQLTKMSENSEVKAYFTKVFELKQSGKEFPVNLDEVWALVYGRRDVAVKTLKSDFVENVDYQPLRQKVERSYKDTKGGGHNRIDYYLSVECMEYFIAKKVKLVFDVYRQVFHKAVDEAHSASRQLGEKASEYRENMVITVKMGNAVNQIYVTGGIIFAKFSPIMRHLGYMQGGSTQYVARIGEKHFKKIPVGLQDAWFIDLEGYSKLLEMTKIQVSSGKMNDVFRLFRVEMANTETRYTHQFTDGEMLAIISELMRSPVNKIRVQQLLMNGKR